MNQYIRTLLTVTRHISLVQRSMNYLCRLISDRSEKHDMSKFKADEFEGFSYFGKLDPALEYGSPEYAKALNKILPDALPAIHLHQERNSHHPEHHKDPKDMDWLDILEMVSDWHGACYGYNDNGDFDRSVEVGLERNEFSDAQEWLILQIAETLKQSDISDYV